MTIQNIYKKRKEKELSIVAIFLVELLTFSTGMATYLDNSSTKV